MGDEVEPRADLPAKPNRRKGRLRDELAAAWGISPRCLANASWILDRAPELVPLVEAGRLKLNAAMQIARLWPEPGRRVEVASLPKAEQLAAIRAERGKGSGIPPEVAAVYSKVRPSKELAWVLAAVYLNATPDQRFEFWARWNAWMERDGLIPRQ